MVRIGIIYPYIFSLFPIIFLFSRNYSHVRIWELFIPATVSLAGTFIILKILRVISRNKTTAAILSSILVLIFYSYRHFVELFRHVTLDIGSVQLGYNYLYLIFAISLVIAHTLLIILTFNLNALNPVLNFFSLVLLAMPIVTVINNNLQKTGFKDPLLLNQYQEELQLPQVLPDVYYIVPDAYARGDILQELYDFDNSDFVEFLESHGFSIANDAITNYNQTVHSMASTMNMDYLEFLGDTFSKESNYVHILSEAMNNSAILNLMRDLDYEIVTYDAAIWNGIEIRNPDVFFSTTQRFSLSLFQNEILNTTLFSWLIKQQERVSVNPYDFLRERIRFAFGQIGNYRSDKPLFVYAHILSPHQPFVFDRYGEPVYPDYPFSIWTSIEKETYIAGYTEQLKFVNTQLKEIIERILSQASRETIIILQADHGPGSQIDREDHAGSNHRERMPILMAVRTTDQDMDFLPDTTSSVNLFRLILNRYYGTSFELLPNRAFYASWSDPFELIEVTDRIDTKTQVTN